MRCACTPCTSIHATDNMLGGCTAPAPLHCLCTTCTATSIISYTFCTPHLRVYNSFVMTTVDRCAHVKTGIYLCCSAGVRRQVFNVGLHWALPYNLARGLAVIPFDHSISDRLYSLYTAMGLINRVNNSHVRQKINVLQALRQRGVRAHRTQDMLEPGHASRTHLGHLGHLRTTLGHT